MKKLILIVLVCALGIPSMAQEFRVGATAGVNVNIPSGEYSGQTGINVGVKAELGLPHVTKGWLVDFGALLSSHGWNSRGYYDNTTGTLLKWEATPYYLNIPVHMGYKFNCSDNFKFFAAVGPYLNIGLFGKEMMTATVLNQSTTTTASNNVFSDKAQERFVWGVGLRLGAELYENWQLSVGYDWDMKAASNTGMHNRTLCISCAFLF